MRFTLITQVVLLTLSVAIIFLFIKPALAEIKTIQDDLLVYSDAVAKASEYNKQLQKLISDRDSFSQTDLEKLERFIPPTIDAVAVMHEIENIFSSKNIEIESLTAGEKNSPTVAMLAEGETVSEDAPQEISTQDFEVKFQGDYDSLKAVLGVLEANARLLEIMNVSYGAATNADVVVEAETAEPSGDQVFTIVLRAYSLDTMTAEQPIQ